MNTSTVRPSELPCRRPGQHQRHTWEDVDLTSYFCHGWNRPNSRPTKENHMSNPTPFARVYVNVNEEGEDYDSHDTLDAALAVQDEFPNDTIQIRVVASVSAR